MTAEVAVLNRNAVALAADSAVTLRHPDGLKIYHTNKLFSLSKYEPVAIMLFGNADFLGVPWEMVIKAYRQRLGTKSFGSIEDYGQDFLKFVRSNPVLFPVRLQENSCYWWVREWLQTLKKRLRKVLEQQLRSKKTITEKEARNLFRNIIKDEELHLRRGHKVLPAFRGVRITAFRSKCANPIKRAVKDELEKLADVVPPSRIMRLAVRAITASSYWHGESGIVVAGFGTKEFFPSLRSFRVDSLIAGRLRFAHDNRRSDISTSMRAAVIAFAQSEMVSLFMNGIDDDFAEFMATFVSHSLLQKYPELVLKLVGEYIPKRSRSGFEKSLGSIGGELVKALSSDVSTYRREMHSAPIVDIVAHLPKEELAAMAEALVNLTSFKRHVTGGQAETVGGPIDVAVISKGDGLIWIKRKHYFKAELNPQFFSNYYQDH